MCREYLPCHVLSHATPMSHDALTPRFTGSVKLKGIVVIGGEERQHPRDLKMCVHGRVCVCGYGYVYRCMCVCGYVYRCMCVYVYRCMCVCG